MFSPYYARARRKGAGDPENFCALNVALYGEGGHRWAMTERGRRWIERTPTRFTIGPSAMRWEDGALVIDIDEVTVPIPSRLRGQVRLTPSAICAHEVRLDPRGEHVWRPVAPFSRIDVKLDRPGLRWSGIGYHDSNWGEVPLEESFESWVWSRAAMQNGASIVYDTVLRDGSRSAFALHVGADGGVAALPLPPLRGMSTTFWRMARHMRAEREFATVSLLEDSPFYARTLLKVETEEGSADAFHESLSLTRFRNPVVQLMLPFKMPRRG